MGEISLPEFAALSIISSNHLFITGVANVNINPNPQPIKDMIGIGTLDMRKRFDINTFDGNYVIIEPTTSQECLDIDTSLMKNLI